MVMIPVGAAAGENEAGDLWGGGEYASPAPPAAVEVLPAVEAVNDPFIPEIAEEIESDPAIESLDSILPSLADHSPVRSAELRIVEISLEMAEIEDRIDEDKLRLKELRKEMSEAAGELRGLREDDCCGRDDGACSLPQAVTPMAVHPNYETHCPQPILVGGKISRYRCSKCGATDCELSQSTCEEFKEKHDSPPPAETAFPFTTPDAWRHVITANLPLETIKGLGDKKRDALIAAAPTIGELEDLRAKAGGKGMHTVLPEGFGKKISGELENRLIDWLTIHRDGMEFSKGRTEEQSDLEDAAAEDVEADEETDLSADEVAEQEASDERLEQLANPTSQSDPETAQKLARLAELRTLNPRPEPAYGLVFDDGQAAARNEWSISDCNWSPGEQQDSWLLGWLAEQPSDVETEVAVA